MGKLIDKLAWIHLRDGKILSTLSKGKDVYYIPGGKRKKGESDRQALMREISEELSVRLQPDSIEYLYTFEARAHGHPPDVRVQMSCYQAEYEGSLLAASEIESFAWLNYQHRPGVSPVDQLIFDWLYKRNLLS